MICNSGCMVKYCPMIRDSVSTRPGSNEWSCFQQGMTLPHNSRGLHCDYLIRIFLGFPKSTPTWSRHSTGFDAIRLKSQSTLALRPARACCTAFSGGAPLKAGSSWVIWSMSQSITLKCGIQRGQLLLHFFVSE